MKQYSLVPENYKEKDPRALPYHFPTTINMVAYAKKMQEFSFYQALQSAEDVAHKQGLILLPWSCIHWQRAKNFGIDRKVKIGRNSYFLMKITELTRSEKQKLENYLVDHLGKELKIS
ncbi:hypothetical protein [Rossellomorea marisflavi]|jgi:hypothetical protein|uniref:hypothetical protein n=1 Tax=Rossellomorea marisflavi TaxID=189381 RepID=UPI003D2EB4B3